MTEYDNANNSIAVSWCPERTYEDMADLFRKLRYAVDSGNREAVADVIGFPFDLNNGGKTVAIRNRAEFKRRYGEIFTPAVVKRLDQASPQAVFCQGGGVGFVDGMVLARNWKRIDVINQ